jgi:heptaprenylglyceryl phosphate synthase
MQILQLVQGVLKLLEKQHCTNSLMNSENIHFIMNADVSGMFYYEHHEDIKIFEEFSSLSELYAVIEKYFNLTIVDFNEQESRITK